MWREREREEGEEIELKMARSLTRRLVHNLVKVPSANSLELKANMFVEQKISTIPIIAQTRLDNC
jgi:hypothetical protein